MKKVLIYSHDTFGLGNIRRMLEVARHLVESSPEVSVLVITGSPMLHAFRIPPGIDYVKLPCLQRNVQGQLRRTLAEPFAARHGAAARQPDPQRHRRLRARPGAGRQEALRRRGRTRGRLARPCRGCAGPRLVLLLRDILDSPEATARVWRKNGYFEAITTYYDQVLVVGCPEVFDLRHEYDFPPFAAAKVRYCGYIAREPGRRTRSECARSSAWPRTSRCCWSPPAAAKTATRWWTAALRGLAGLPAVQRPRMHIVCGPEMAAAQRAAVVAAGTGAAGCEPAGLQRRHDVAAGRRRRGAGHGWLQHRVRTAEPAASAACSCRVSSRARSSASAPSAWPAWGCLRWCTPITSHPAH
jgi:hypothetical protein